MKDTIRECYNKTVTSNKVMKDTIRECYNVTSNKVMNDTKENVTIKQWHQIKWLMTQ